MLSREDLIVSLILERKKKKKPVDPIPKDLFEIIQELEGYGKISECPECKRRVFTGTPCISCM